jgi:hypothetical protein
VRYSTFNILRSSSIINCLHFEDLKIWFGHPSLSLKFEYDPISGNIWGHLPMEVVFILRINKIWFGHIRLSFKFEIDPISGCWDIPLFIFWDSFHLKNLYNKVWSWVGSYKWLPRHSTFDILRSSSFQGFTKYGLVI